MDFKHPNIRRFLIDSLPSRFNNLSPAEFASFMAFVFRTDGYEVEEIDKKGDLSANLLAKKDDTSLVIKALRYHAEQLVNIHEIQQAAAAKTYYDTAQSWIITTSSFTKEARKEADSLDIELWDWDTFYQALSQLFFEGKSHFEFMESTLPDVNTEIKDPELRLKAKWQPEEGISSEWYNLDLIITNPSERNIYIHLDLPALIDPKKNQVSADQWATNEFVAGIIYSGASIRTNALFKASRLGERPPSGRIMLTIHERTDPPSTYHLSAKLKGSACYLVTYCYSMDSAEYLYMIRYRDQILSKRIAGRLFIGLYYLISPLLIKWAPRVPMIDAIIKKMTQKAIDYLKTKY
ncbi:MAG TPA: restriction endonuclease [Saprospiraceae bacterium]|nr:restriction endonuclease [Saprospiraceae bacterium]